MIVLVTISLIVYLLKVKSFRDLRCFIATHHPKTDLGTLFSLIYEKLQ